MNSRIEILNPENVCAFLTVVQETSNKSVSNKFFSTFTGLEQNKNFRVRSTILVFSQNSFFVKFVQLRISSNYLFQFIRKSQKIKIITFFQSLASLLRKFPFSPSKESKNRINKFQFRAKLTAANIFPRFKRGFENFEVEEKVKLLQDSTVSSGMTNTVR